MEEKVLPLPNLLLARELHARHASEEGDITGAGAEAANREAIETAHAHLGLRVVADLSLVDGAGRHDVRRDRVSPKSNRGIARHRSLERTGAGDRREADSAAPTIRRGVVRLKHEQRLLRQGDDELLDAAPAPLHDLTDTRIRRRDVSQRAGSEVDAEVARLVGRSLLREGVG